MDNETKSQELEKIEKRIIDLENRMSKLEKKLLTSTPFKKNGTGAKEFI
ncbi:MAG: hypothetical protein ACFFCE_17110 [Promethearchaeota archaeon]